MLFIDFTRGYIKTAKTENSLFFDSDRNFSVSKSQEISRYHRKFPIFAVLTLLPGVSFTEIPEGLNVKREVSALRLPVGLPAVLKYSI